MHEYRSWTGGKWYTQTLSGAKIKRAPVIFAGVGKRLGFFGHKIKQEQYSNLQEGHLGHWKEHFTQPEHTMCHSATWCDVNAKMKHGNVT